MNVKEIQSFIDFINYNKKFIKNYSKKSLLFTNLIKKKTSWEWNAKHERAFQELKEACLKKSILKMFNSKKLIRIESNALNLIIEACLNQEHKGKWHSMTYFSRKLSFAKQNYDVHDKELFAIVIALKSWRIYVEEVLKLLIFTNHKNLLHFIIIK